MEQNSFENITDFFLDHLGVPVAVFDFKNFDLVFRNEIFKSRIRSEDFRDYEQIGLDLSKSELKNCLSGVEESESLEVETHFNSAGEEKLATRLKVFTARFRGQKSYIFLFNDTAEHRLLLEDLKNKEAFLNETLDSIPGGVFCKSYETSPGTFVYWNRMAEKIWGLQKEQVLDKSDFDFFPESEAKFFQEKDLETIESGKTIYIEQETVTPPDSDEIFVRTWKVPLIIQDKKYLLGISIDISENIYLEKKLKEQEARNIQNSKLASLGEMASGISHEINNPITILHAYFRKLSRIGSENGLNEIVDVCGKAEKSVERIKKIIKSMTSISRDSSEESISEESISEVLDSVLVLTRALAVEKDIRVYLSSSLVEDQEFLVRRIQFEQVLINIISNAIRATYENSENWVKIVVSETNKEINFRVVDGGKGIPEDIASKMFDPFFTTTEIGKGTGLGLSITKNLVESWGGRLKYELFEGNTSFVISVPKDNTRIRVA